MRLCSCSRTVTDTQPNLQSPTSHWPSAAGAGKVLSVTHCHDELKRIFVDSNWGLVFLHHFYL